MEAISAVRIGEQISRGHAFDKHVIQRGEFPGVKTPEQFAKLIDDVVKNGEEVSPERGRSAFWKDGVVVILDPKSPEGGTAFRPIDGYNYFEELKGK
ncbi:mAFB alternative [Leucobacter insecticola]|uniref:MAFB alternative n=1 Tax=Leucobacter insecticola TaxID=2714934 RepID=A0A6G8FIE1_9MICO|nr:mAFB alternative [Leucobacter insecticola]QIM16135.1 mAFB alternative [Leucobacter insecticola]